MNTTWNLFPEETLLSELEWLRGLARCLVRDESTADDVVQEVCRRALVRPPRNATNGGPMRAWLARVARSVVRGNELGERRRDRRERLSARDEGIDVVEAVTLRRDLVGAVLALGEPYRTTLLQHYFEQREISEIARVHGVTEAAVRQRLSRARGQLRESLAAAYGDGDRGWRRALMPLTVGDEPHSVRRRVLPFLVPVALAGLGALAITQLYGQQAEEPAPSTRYAYAPTPPPPFLKGLAGWLEGRIEEGPSAGASPTHRRAGLELFPPRGDEELERLNAELPLRVLSARRVAAGASSLLDRIATHTGLPRELLASTEVFEGRAQDDTNGEFDCTLVRQRIDLENEELILVVAVRDGRAVTMGGWGSAEFDQDEHLAWGIFISQLLTMERNRPALTLESPSADEVRGWMDRMAKSTRPGDRVSLALVEQHGVMSANVLHSRSLRLLKRQGKRPPAAWARERARDIQGMGERAGLLATVLGDDGVEAYEGHAREAAAAFEALARATEKVEEAGSSGLEDPSDLEDYEIAVEVLGEACSICHKEQTAAGVEFFDVFDSVLAGGDLPVGALLVGYDLAPASGASVELSKQVATGFRAAVILAAERR